MISIIGAGPAGSYLASLLAEHEEVNIYEEHESIGKPVQCSGLVTSALSEFVPLKKEFVINKIKKVRLISPKGRLYEINLKDADIVLDREKFDQYLVNKAKNNGARLFLKHKFIDYSDNKIKVNNKLIKTDILIGADGPLSRVAKSVDLFGERTFLLGKQARVKLKNDNVYEVYFGASPDFFGWVIPENKDIARIGVSSATNIDLYFKKFLRGKVLNYQVGLIPIYNPKLKTQKDNVYLIGDAATQVKASTGGGIIPSLIIARELELAIKNKQNYEKRWKKKIGKDLYTNLLIRKMLNKFSDEDYDILLDILKNRIGEYQRDKAFKSLSKLVVDPKLLLFLLRRTKYLYR